MKTSTQPKDVENAKFALSMTDKELSTAIKRSIEKLNRRLSSLEKSGWAERSRSYGRIANYLQSEFGKTRFSSKKVQYASKKERAEFYARLKHYEEYGLTQKAVKAQLKLEHENFNDKIKKYYPEIKNITFNQFLTLDLAMKAWREYIGTSTLFEAFNSDEARMFFTDQIEMNQSDIDQFISELEKFEVDKDTGTSIYNIQDFAIFKDNYDVNYGTSAIKVNDLHIVYNPMTGKVFNKYYEETEYEYYEDSGIIIKDGEEYTYDPSTGEFIKRFK